MIDQGKGAQREALLFSIKLEAADGVSKDESGRHVATSAEPWLTILPFDPGLAGRIVEIGYTASFFDEPVRPVFRFHRSDGSSVDRFGAGPVLGSQIWVGRIPPGTVSLSVSPTNRTGRFDFGVDHLRVRAWSSLIARGMIEAPSYAWRALILKLIGHVAESDAILAAFVAAMPLRRFAAWSDARRRPLDLAGLDRPRFDWSMTRVVCLIPGADQPAALAVTRRSLAAQAFPHWSAIVFDASAARFESSDPRFEFISTPDLQDRALSWDDDHLVCVLRPGDSLMPETLALVAEQAHRHAADAVFYGDLLRAKPNGTQEPQFVPGWLPHSRVRPPSLEPPVFVRAAKVRPETLPAFLAAGRPPEVWLAGGARALRRVLAVRAAGVSGDDRSETSALGLGKLRPHEALRARGLPAATIVIPTSDQPKLLGRALRSIGAHTAPDLCEIIVVNDGGSRRTLEAAIEGLSLHIRLLDHHEGFNFSAICNRGAAAARGQTLVFLNDDIEVLSCHWLERLLELAADPDVGAVGARLTYPDGRLQHIGMVVGWGETAGHFGARADGDDPGWAFRNRTVREVSAVTGACLAVARYKFDAVAGFDEQHLPIELGDVDLCLRLRAQGWRTLLDPHVHLMHAESQSRGRATFRPLSIHANERAVFRARWRDVIRDDPYFHPALSLFRLQPFLG